MKLPLSSQTWGKEEVEVAKFVIESGNTTMGKHVREFEESFAHFFNSKYAVMCNSGSSANLLALAAITYLNFNGDVTGKEIIVPAISWSTTYYPVKQLGYSLRFVDVDEDSLNLSMEEVEKAINPSTVGIFAVNLLGQPANLIKLKELARAHNLFLIEDNCESMGAELEDRFAGTFGEIGTFSFFFSHHINTMEGGMCVTDDERLFHYLLSLRAHGWTRELPASNYVFNKTGVFWDDHFRFVLPGYNFRPLEVSGAIGKEQLRKFPFFLQERRENHRYFQNLFSDSSNVRIQSGEGISSSFAFSLVLTGSLTGKRAKVLEILQKSGVETRPIVAGNFVEQPVMKYLRAEFGALPVAEYVHQNGFYLGNHHYDVRNELGHIRDIIERAI